MTYDESQPDEDWYDDEDDLDDVETASCPECGGEVFDVAERCPACGYWFSEADRRALWTRHSKPRWLRLTAIVILVAFLVSLIAWFPGG